MTSYTHSIRDSQSYNAYATFQHYNSTLIVPQDVILEILARLNGQGVGRCARVCWQWSQILSRNEFWQSLFYRHFPRRDSTEIVNFRQAYQNQCLYLPNLMNAMYTTRTLHYPSEVQRILIHENKQIVSTHLDGSINLWDLKTGSLLKTYFSNPYGRGASSKYSVIDDNLLISAQTGVHRCILLFINLEDPRITVTRELSFEFVITSLFIGHKKLILGFNNKTICCIPLDTIRQGVASGELITSGFAGNPTWLNFTGKKLFSVHENKEIIIHNFANNTFTFNSSLDIYYASLKSMLLPWFSDSPLGDTDLSSESFVWFDWDNQMCILDPEKNKWAETKTSFQDAKTSAIHEGKMLTGYENGKISIHDFVADRNEVLERLARLMTSSCEITKSRAEDWFKKIPESIRQGIYQQLGLILNFNDAIGTGEKAFYNREGFFSFPEKRAQAIQNYVNERRLEDDHPLLEHLGIVSSYDYSEILKCRPDYLPKIGILSSEDIKLLCSPIVSLEKLATVEENEGEPRSIAFKRKEKLCSCLELLEKVATARGNESLKYHVLFYESGDPWEEIREKLGALRTRLQERNERSRLPKEFLIEFSHENYVPLATELNELIDLFQLLDQNHQIARLHAYINQYGIYTAWQAHKRSGTNALSALPQTSPALQNPFQMGI